MAQALREIVQQFLRKLNIQLPCDTTVELLDIYPGNMNTYVHRKARM